MKMQLNTIYFNYIKDGIKLYETRVYDKKRQKIKLSRCNFIYNCTNAFYRLSYRG